MLARLLYQYVNENRFARPSKLSHAQAWVASYYPPEVKAFFCRDQQNKESLAEAMIERYPFLGRHLTFLPWRRRYWFHVFHAIGLGLMCHEKLVFHKELAR